MLKNHHDVVSLTRNQVDIPKLARQIMASWVVNNSFSIYPDRNFVIVPSAEQITLSDLRGNLARPANGKIINTEVWKS